jgi:hypothetical protein
VLRRFALFLLLTAVAHAAAADTVTPDLRLIREAQVALGVFHDIDADIDCGAPALTAHQLMCADETLWQMGLLDTWAWVFFVEDSTGTEMDHGDPPLDEAFISDRDLCRDRACLIGVIVRHTNDSLGGASPYAN